MATTTYTTMASASVFSPIDNGPTWGPLDVFLRKFNTIKEGQTAREIFDTLFPFLRTEAYAQLASEIHSRKADFSARSASDQNTMRLRSLASFIFTSNAIEDCGTATVEETQEIIDARSYPDIKGKHDVVSTLSVLRKTYKPRQEEMRAATIYSVSNLKSWHSDLTGHDQDGCNPGVLRTRGAYTYRKAGRKEKHNYPHHHYVEGALAMYCQVLQQLVALCSLYEKEGYADAALVWFAVAAFAQFHFVTLHPFRDGNGRMCRLIAKLVLDCWMPVAIPMFPAKEDYFQALIKGQTLEHDRDANEFLCVEPLFSLLMITANQWLDRVIHSRTRIYVRFENASGLTERVSEALSKCGKLPNATATAEVQSLIENSRAKLQPYSSASFDIAGDVTITLSWSPAIETLPQVADDEASKYPCDEDNNGSNEATRMSVSFDDDFV